MTTTKTTSFGTQSYCLGWLGDLRKALKRVIPFVSTDKTVDLRLQHVFLEIKSEYYTVTTASKNVVAQHTTQRDSEHTFTMLIPVELARAIADSRDNGYTTRVWIEWANDHIYVSLGCNYPYGWNTTYLRNDLGLDNDGFDYPYVTSPLDFPDCYRSIEDCYDPRILSKVSKALSDCERVMVRYSQSPITGERVYQNFHVDDTHIVLWPV